MLTGHTHISINSQFDVTSGRTQFLVPLNPVPIITAMGPAPGELRISSDSQGAIKKVEALLRPDAASVREMAPVLTRVASFELSAALLENLPDAASISLTFEMTASGLNALSKLLVRSASDVLTFLDSPVLGDVLAFRLVDLKVGT
ncbi:MAG: hypothetical protein VKN33_04720 [Candidatus Sericytochromatia bacterium]|nr:hypothetical protein [Candidatus Sericytochromatia bacterium]